MNLLLPHPPSALIITADDFGFGVATSRGILQAHRAGVVTSTSFMVVTGDHAAASATLLAEAPKLEVGLHLVMSGPGQRPLTATKASGLLGRNGGFLPLPRLLWRAYRRKLDRAAVLDEIVAQAKKCESLLGRCPAYVDGHHHAHQLPIIREALIEAMNLGILPSITRSTIEPPVVRANVRGSSLRRAVMHRLGVAASPHFKAAGIRMNDWCFGMIGPRDWTSQPSGNVNPWEKYLPHLPADGVVEWFVHPGEPDPSLLERDTYFRERPLELNALIQLATRPAWERWKNALTTRGAIAARTTD